MGKLTKEEKLALKKEEKYEDAVREKEIYEAKIARKMKKYEQRIEKAQNYLKYKSGTEFSKKIVSSNLWKYMKPKKKLFIALIVFAIFSALFQTVTLWAFGYIYDKFFTPQEASELVTNWQTLLGAFIAVIVIMFVMYILNAVFNWSFLELSKNIFT